MNDNSFKLAMINDIHYCSKRPVADATLNANISMLNDSDVDLVINLGDNVMDAMQSITGKLKWDIAGVYNAFSALKKPTIGAVGNHDFVNENRNPDELIELWNHTNADAYNVVTKQLNEKWMLIVIPSITIIPESTQGYDAFLTDKQYQQFEEALRNNAATNNKNVVIASHVPIMSITPLMDRKHPMNRKSYEFPANHIHADAYKLVELMQEYPQVKLCLSGHMHMVDRVDYKNISYVCCGSLCGMWWSLPVYKGHHAGNMFVDLESYGTFTMNYKHFNHIK